MKLRIGKRQIWLLCGLLLALPVAHAKKYQDEDSERQQRGQQQDDQQQSERSAPTRGGYLEKDKPRNNTKSNRENRRYAPQPQSQPQSQPRYDNGYERRDSNRNYAPDDRRGGDRNYVPEQRYEPAPRYESAPRYAPRQMNLSEAVAAAERSTGGRVLSADPIDEGGRLSYRVKVLTPNGRVSVLYLDAQ